MNRNLAKVGKPTRWPPGSLEDYLLMREVIAAIREGLPDADQLQPGAVFQHVLGALRNCPNNTQNTNSSICSGQIRE
jgi:hypothetical protein